MLLSVPLFVSGLVLLVCSSLPVATHSTAFAVIGSVSVLLMDVSDAAGLRSRAWSLIVLALDSTLIFGFPGWAQALIVGMTLVALAVEQAEATARFGLYEFVGNIHDGSVPAVCDCLRPPCPRPLGSAVNGFLGMLTVFLTDFALTRGFAVGLKRQLALVDASVAVAEQVAKLLAAYSVAEAESVVAQDGGKLPPALRAALELLLSNLKTYRQYLPQSLLSQVAEEVVGGAASEEEDKCVVEPPAVGLPELKGFASLCFTDIQSSTELWEQHPQGMYEALQTHNKVMRRTAATSGGYEVKTIGDAFMLCFATAEGSCRFALDAQRQLLQQHWPPDIMQHELCYPVADPRRPEVQLFSGLRVRMGVNCGNVRVQRNPITGRYDYFGRTVNVAARVEAAVKQGGLVGVTDAVLVALGPDGLAELGSPHVTALGYKELKGVQEHMLLHVMLPAELAARAEVLLPALRRSGRQESIGTQSTVSTLPEGMSRCSDTPSPQTARLDLSMRAQHLEALTLQLRRSQASCATLRAPLSVLLTGTKGIGGHLAAVEAAAGDSAGVVTAVLSGAAVVSWNAARASNPAASCAHFVQSVLRDPRALLCHCGAASGAVVSGNVSSGRQCHSTVIGGCVELSADGALAAGGPALSFAAAGLAHWAQLWADGEGPITVWELRVRSEQVADDDGASRWGELCPQSPAQEEHVPQWVSGITAREFERIAGLSSAEQIAALQQLCDQSPGDVRIDRLLGRAKRGALRTRRLPLLPETDRPG
eukprot:TRINITY_DN14781_c0_g1_i1.p1 TRINITY_DN14781_c0_g1~~TRINITY_DN14781_c0_g1_i1.p1  ORF type:complete len:856 (+),score=207.59 TRINITY_DN14781_c0_g1_i1:278-2569(+)